MHVLFEAVLQRRNLSKVRICSCFFDLKLQFKVRFKIAFRKFLLQAFCKWLTFYDCLNLPLLPFAYFHESFKALLCSEKTTLYASCMLLSSDCLDLRNLWSTSAASPTSKNFLVLVIWTFLAPKWPILVLFCEMDHQKSNFSLIFGTLSVGGCWGQPMLLFWKLVVKTQMPHTQEYTDTFIIA